LPIQGSGDNKQYIRFILPAWATLSSRGKIRLENVQTRYPHTILGGYITTRPGGNSTLKFQYTLPKDQCNTQTKFFKQAGLKDTIFRIEKDGKVLSEQFYQ
jgi:hypothetical protein